MFHIFSISLVILYFDFSCGHRNFWFVSDIHIDLKYSREGNPQKFCHKDGSIHRDVGLYGNFLCDSPVSLAHATVDAMKDIQPNPDFIVFTGDNFPHLDADDVSWDVVFEGINKITQLISSSFPNTPIYPNIGNHDTSPPNILSPSNTDAYDGYLQRGGWNKLLSRQAIATFRRGGFYSEIVRPGLRLISLNTILWYSLNNFTTNVEDPANQFRWLKIVLNESKLQSEKVYIIGHVPPGFYSRPNPGQKGDLTYHKQFLGKYLDILHQYTDIIIGQMYGHYHLDYFLLFRFNTGVYKNSAILASSVTPWHDKDEVNVSLPINPSFKLMHYSESDFTLLDFQQYYMNLTRENRLKESGLLYHLLYKFTTFYGVPDLSTKSLVRVYENLKKDDQLYKKFFYLLTVGKKSADCDSACKINQLCAMSGTSIQEYDQCISTMDKSNTSTFTNPVIKIVNSLRNLFSTLFQMF